MKTKFLRYSLFAFFVFSLDTHAAGEWTGWLGAKRNGWVEGFEAPRPWPQHLHKRWRTQVGSGYGTPLVWEDRVYQHAREGEAEVLYCLDLETGKRLWRQSIQTPFRVGSGGEFHGKGPKSTPTLASNRIFTLGISGVLTAWNQSTGTILWHRDDRHRFQKAHPYWGSTTSPIVDGQKLFIHLGGDDQGMLFAFDVKNGKTIWQLGNDGASYASPFIAEIEGIRQLVELNHNALLGVEIETGTRLWEYSFPHIEPNQNMPSPVFHRGKILLGGENRGIRSIEPRMQNGTWQVKEHWHQKRLALDTSTAIVSGDWLFGFSHYQRGQLFCLDIETGKILWKGPPRAGDHATFLAIADHIIALMDDGELQIFSSKSPDYQKVASYEVSEQPTWAPPVLLNEGFLIKDKTSLTFWTFEDDIEK